MWERFQRAELTPEKKSFVVANGGTIPYAIFRNDLYEVWQTEEPERKGFPKMWHLSIKRLDREPICDWRHLQRIKNEIVGKTHEGIQLFPHEARKQDEANQYHLYVLREAGVVFPFGDPGPRRVSDVIDPQFAGAKQRPLEDEDR